MGMKTFKMCCFRLASWFLFYYFGGSDSSKCIVKTNCTFFYRTKQYISHKIIKLHLFVKTHFPAIVLMPEKYLFQHEIESVCASLTLTAWGLRPLNKYYHFIDHCNLLLLLQSFYFLLLPGYLYNKFITLHHYLLMTSPGHFTSMK